MKWTVVDDWEDRRDDTTRHDATRHDATRHETGHSRSLSCHDALYRRQIGIARSRRGSRSMHANVGTDGAELELQLQLEFDRSIDPVQGERRTARKTRTIAAAGIHNTYRTG
mmetsp:Transcript_26207/g.56175  ORF Transcript_26207/g.56175 Transcript_26207/m.56175 type:complete len:112 (-) Transcript_26207:4637-4972(-)